MAEAPITAPTTAQASATVAPASVEDHPGDPNEVHLVGRLAAPVEERALPSGTTIASFRLIVRRPSNHGAPGAARRQSSDAIHCAAWTESLRHALADYRPGDILDVQGALRRRFWRSAGAPAGGMSLFEIELTHVARLASTVPLVRSKTGPESAPQPP